jgi:hypothetical protein
MNRYRIIYRWVILLAGAVIGTLIASRLQGQTESVKGRKLAILAGHLTANGSRMKSINICHSSPKSMMSTKAVR